MPRTIYRTSPTQEAEAMRNFRATNISLILAASAGVASAAPDAGARLQMRALRDCHDALLNQQASEPVPAAAASCPPDLLIASTYYEAIKDLAVHGDRLAQRCFIQGYFASAAQEGDQSRMR